MTLSSSDQEAALSSSLERLKAGGFRITNARRLLLRALLKLDQPATVDGLFAKLPKGSFDLVTLYRNLSAFETVGLVSRTFQYNGAAMFLHDALGPKFFALTRTGREVFDLSAVETADLHLSIKRMEARLKEAGYTELSHAVQFYVD